MLDLLATSSCVLLASVYLLRRARHSLRPACNAPGRPPCQGCASTPSSPGWNV
jgi:hypothetical protein